MASIRDFNFSTNTSGRTQNERTLKKQTSYVYFGDTINVSKMLILMNALTKKQQVKIVSNNPNVRHVLSILGIRRVVECIKK